MECNQTTSVPTALEEFTYDDDETPPVIREEDPNLEAKLDEMFAVPPASDRVEMDDF